MAGGAEGRVFFVGEEGEGFETVFSMDDNKSAICSERFLGKEMTSAMMGSMGYEKAEAKYQKKRARETSLEEKQVSR